jgi:hypothetical protein
MLWCGAFTYLFAVRGLLQMRGATSLRVNGMSICKLWSPHPVQIPIYKLLQRGDLYGHMQIHVVSNERVQTHAWPRQLVVVGERWPGESIYRRYAQPPSLPLPCRKRKHPDAHRALRCSYPSLPLPCRKRKHPDAHRALRCSYPICTFHVHVCLPLSGTTSLMHRGSS